MILEDIIEKRGEHCAEELRLVSKLILDAHPAIRETQKWGIPFYTLKKDLIYLDVQRGKPLMAFIHGRKLGELSDFLDFTGRKQVGHYSLLNLDEKKHTEICLLIDAAVEYDLSRN